MSCTTEGLVSIFVVQIVLPIDQIHRSKDCSCSVAMFETLLATSTDEAIRLDGAEKKSLHGFEMKMRHSGVFNV